MATPLQIPILGDLEFDSKALNLIKEIRERNTRYSQDILHKAYENVLFDYNRQWVIFDPTVQQFRPKRTSAWIPKPSTNKFSAVMRPLISNLAGLDPQVLYIPTSEDPADVATANVASRIVEIARQETNIAFTRLKLARWVGLTGNGWLVSGYDKDQSYGMTQEQAEMCVACQKTMMADDIEKEGGCPWCKEAGQQSPGFVPAMDASGAPVMGQRPRGAMFSELSTLFEMEYDHEADDFGDSLYAMRLRSRDREWAKSHFNLSDEELKPGDTGVSALVQQRYLQSLAYVSPLGYQLYQNSLDRETRVLVTEFWCNPTQENQQGFYTVHIGNNLVYKGPYKYHAPDSSQESPKPVRPTAHFGYQIAAGRVAFRTPADDITNIQRTRNELESIYKLHSRRGANMIMFVPDGTNMSKVSGEEGIIVRYTAMAGIPPPRREQGLESPRFIREWIDLLDASMEIVAGSVDVLRGEAPAGLEAYAALQALEAKAVQALAESRALWNVGWANWSSQMLGIFKEYCIDNREFSMRGENGQWSIQKFKSADLAGGLRVLPDLQAQGPSSPVARRASLEQAIRVGLVNPMDPREKYQALKIIGVTEVMPDMDVDMQAAARENDAFSVIFTQQGPGEPPKVNPFIDNHEVHVATHRRFFLSDKGQALGPLGQGALVGHQAQHMALIQQAMMAAPGKPSTPENRMAPSEGKTVRSEAGAASQPERANDMGPKPKGQGKRAARLSEIKSEQNV